MKRLLFLSAVLSVRAIAAPFGACVPGSPAGHIGNACASSDRLFENFTYSGSADALRINIDFQTVGTEFRPIMAPVARDGFFTSLSSSSFADKITVPPGVTPNIASDDDQIAGVQIAETEDQSNFSLVPSTPGQLPSLELGNVQADAVVPEPASLGLIGAGLLCLGLIRKRAVLPGSSRS